MNSKREYPRWYSGVFFCAYFCPIEKKIKYRRLNLEELEALKEEFIQFLASNSITADEWTEIKENKIDTAEELISVFSEIAWDKILTNIQFLEVRSKSALTVFHFGKEKAELIRLHSKNEEIDFTDLTQLQRGTSYLFDEKKGKPEIIKGAKEYSSSRNEELYLEMQKGAAPTSGKLWESLTNLIGE